MIIVINEKDETMAQALEIQMECGYYVFEYKQSSYTLRFNNEEWELSSLRKGRGAYNIPSYRFFKTLEDLEKNIKGLKGISQLITV